MLEWGQEQEQELGQESEQGQLGHVVCNKPEVSIIMQQSPVVAMATALYASCQLAVSSWPG